MPLDFYPLARPFLFRLDAERAHAAALWLLKKGLVPSSAFAAPAILRAKMGPHELEHPLGLAPGFDKHAEVIGSLFDMGFSFAEIGGVTPLSQPGNPKPRLFRAPEAKAVINRFGFNSAGAETVAARVDAWRKTARPRILGVNLGKNKETADAADDYVKGVAAFAARADFLTLNISSPNTPGLRDMQARGNLIDLLRRVRRARAESGHNPLLFLKIAPDITFAQARDIAEIALDPETAIDALVVGNTTLSRPPHLPEKFAKETGGLSGKPLFELSTGVLRQMYRLTQGKIPLIGVGGIFTGADAYAKIRAGASLLQLYTALVYEGPCVVARIARELAALLKRDGFSALSEAVGADTRKS